MSSEIKLLDTCRKFYAKHRDRAQFSLAAATAIRVLLLGCVLGFIFSLLVFAIAQRLESQRQMENVTSLLSTVEATARAACFTGDKILALEAVKGLLANRSVSGVRITSGSEVLAEQYKQADPYAAGKSATMVRKMSSPFNEEDIVGEIALFADEEQIRAQANRYSWLIVMISIVEIFIVALAVAWVVLRRIARPIRNFSQQLGAINVGRGGFVTCPAGNETNEIGLLADSFNHLLARLLELVRSEQSWRLQLAHKESRFRALAENSPNLIVRYDAACNPIYSNPAFDAKSGIVLDEASIQHWQACNVDAAAYREILQAVMASGSATHVLLEWRHEEGYLVSHDFHLVPEWDEDGRISSVLGIGHDISAFKRQQKIDAERSLIFENLVHGKELFDVLSRVAQHVDSTLSGCVCAILLFEKGVVHIGAAPGLPASWREAIDGQEVDLFRGTAEFPESIPELDQDISVSWYEEIVDSEKRVLGALLLFPIKPQSQEEIDANFMRQACSLASIAIERKHVENRVLHQASYDALTDLPNRRMFTDKLREEISRADRNVSNVTLLFIDLDRFKAVNDSLGHEAGDRLLQEAASRICACMRATDTVARLGGDEFVVVIPDVADVAHLGRLAKNIVEALTEPFELNGKIAYVSASVGIASYPSDADNLNNLVSYADQAMYAAKECGRKGFHFYSEALSVRADERLALEIDLRGSLVRGELELYFQPKINLADGAMLGSEALLRWHHPERGMVPPDKFIGIAEDCGLIVEIGAWVLRSGCVAACEWNGEGKPLHKVAINLSARQFLTGDLVQTVLEVFEETGCRPEWIELEITESLLMDEDGKVLGMLQAFSDMGITIAIDDFGTGYSSLSYLARFPITTLKIDRSFTSMITQQGHHAELVKAILSMARSLNQQVVAEGVETRDQAEFLCEHGCDIAQGYLYSKPVAKTAFESLFQTVASPEGVRA